MNYNNTIEASINMITVKDDTLQNIVPIECDIDEDISNIVAKFHDIRNDKPIKWRVLYNGKQLEYDRTLFDYGITNNSQLIFIRHLLNGSNLSHT